MFLQLKCDVADGFCPAPVIPGPELEQWQQLLEERRLAARVIERDVKINSRKIKISVKADFKSPLFGMLPENMKIWTLQCEESASGINPVTIIRGVKKNNGS